MQGNLILKLLFTLILRFYFREDFHVKVHRPPLTLPCFDLHITAGLSKLVGTILTNSKR